MGGPVLRNSLFVSAALDYERFRSNSDPLSYSLPTPVFAQMAPAGSAARQLLEMFPIPGLSNATAPVVNERLAPPVSIDQILAAVPRVDYLPRGGEDRLFARLALSHVDRPDFVWTPYPQFTTPLQQDDTALALGWVRSLTASTSNELRGEWNADNLFFNRQHPEIPGFQAGCGESTSSAPLAPRRYHAAWDPLFYSYQNDSHDVEINDNLIHEHGRHVVKFGAGALLRHLNGYLTAGRDGLIGFDSPQESSGGHAVIASDCSDTRPGRTCDPAVRP